MPSRKPEAKREEAERLAFVISPIGEPDSPERKRADQILKHVIEPIVSEFGYKAIRSNKISKPGIITSQIIDHIINDPLVVADLTGHNPNVFYELAVRHAIKKPVIQMIKKGERIPFDVRQARTIQIDHQDLDSVDEAKEELRKQTKAVEKDPTLVDSPISMAVDLKLLKQSGDPFNKVIAELRGSLQTINATVQEMYGKMEGEERRKSAERYRESMREMRQRETSRDRIKEMQEEIAETLRRMSEQKKKQSKKKS